MAFAARGPTEMLPCASALRPSRRCLPHAPGPSPRHRPQPPLRAVVPPGPLPPNVTFVDGSAGAGVGSMVVGVGAEVVVAGGAGVDEEPRLFVLDLLLFGLSGCGADGIADGPPLTGAVPDTWASRTGGVGGLGCWGP